MPAVSFKTWLGQQRGRADAVGDLASWAAAARYQPHGRCRLAGWVRHLKAHRAATVASLEALALAWREYEASR
jgi:hypothetical protein